MKSYTITVNGNVYNVTVEENADGTVNAAPVRTAPVSKAAPAATGTADVPGSVKIEAPMSGKILSVKATAGQAVKRGEVIMVLEAMKMENEIVAPSDGTVASIEVAAGSAVESGDVLATLK